ncbi:MAG TPA: phage holin family protein [Candidatus Bathyarchaeia archaeon]|nr:phage holin family protein [Candidatus Bathyarchaeia archaeon]
MSGDDEKSFIEKIFQELIRRTLGKVSESIERSIKRAVRKAAMAFGGVIIALLGFTFLAVGIIKGLSLLMPNWLAWSLVGIIILLVGISLTLASVNR